MAKKLVTNNEQFVSKVENVLNNAKIPCARVQLKSEKDKGIIMLVTINRYGDQMRKAVEENKDDKTTFFFGSLRKHPEYTVPRDILIKLAE